MNKFWGIALFFLLLSSVCWAAGKEKKQTQSEPPQSSSPPASLYWTGTGGKEMSIAILAPKATGLEKNQGYLPALVQGEFVSNFSGFSAISVLDRERLDEQYAELFSGYYDDNAKAGLDLGHLTPTTHIMGGNITRTATGYALQIQITKTADKMTTASYSGTLTFAELDNLTGIRRASLDLLQKMGVTLTAQTREELAGAAKDNHVSAQTALARGITAQKQGTEVAALSYYFQAAAYDPSLMEAANRSSILNANISSGNIGDNVRNDIAWRKDWVTRLTETEQYFDSFNRTESMPYTLFYISGEIKQGAVNYQNESVALSIETHLHGSGIWTVSIERALQAVYNGLDATTRKDTWGLASWPRQGVTNLNAFAGRRQNFAVVFELLNSQNKVIGRQTLQTGGSWGLNWSGRPTVNVDADERKTLTFQNVNANDISDSMTIRITTVNGADAETAARNGVLQIRTITREEVDRYNQWRFAKGAIQGFANDAARKAEIAVTGTRYTGMDYYRNVPTYRNVKELNIPNIIWGDPVVFIGNSAFAGLDLDRVSIPDSVIYIGREAFANNSLISIKGGNGVTSIGAGAFWKAIDGQGIFNTINIPNRVTSIGEKAFGYWRTITIGANVDMAQDSWGFINFYNENGRKAGTYHDGEVWSYVSFPSQFMGTWKRDKFDNTLTFTANTLKASNQSYTWKLTKVSGNYFTMLPDTETDWITDTDKSKKIWIKIGGGKLKIFEDKSSGDDNWNGNGTWKKQ
ncbi:MAG: leucine-rich repeat domain-containing protein [Treponema sp.]|jgi:hypothetical protein|nr:leucine-rich repeat domain-containing protein [Treponema sp.]